MSETESPPEDANGDDLSPNQKAAHRLLTQLRTRIATQDLPYQHGIEETALKSLVDIFAETRKTIEDHPGCEAFADLAVAMLNSDIRPVTAKWHRLSEQGILKSRDGSDDFREDLANLQKKLRKRVLTLRKMAYGDAKADDEIEGPFSDKEVAALIDESIPYGIPETDQIEVMRKDLAKTGLETSGVDEINQLESETVEARRDMIQKAAEEEGIRKERPPAGADATGLACSGGGVRSATFALGVIQVLADKGLLKSVDFLSTVSGGGFTGSFLTRRLNSIESEKTVGGATGPDPEPIRYLRQRAKYLTSQNLWEAWGMVSSTIAGMIINWMVPLCVIAFLAVITVWGEEFSFWKKYESIIYLLLSLFTFASALWFFVSLRSNQSTAKLSGKVLAGTSVALIAAAIWKVLSILYRHLFGTRPHKDLSDVFESLGDSLPSELLGSGGIGIGSVAVLVPAILRFVPVLKNPKIRALLNKAALVLAGLFLPIAGIGVYFLLCAIGKLPGIPITQLDQFYNGSSGGLIFIAALAVTLFVLTFLFLNINLTAPHRLYRNGLAGTFVKDEESDSIDLAEVNEVAAGSGKSIPGFAPYHLINAAANLPTSTSPGLRERLCDFFLFSKHFSGSPVVGFRPTGDWNMNGKPVDLASAMAISGAAFSSNMGMSSIRPLRALLTFLNVRLGFWIRRPHMPALIGKPGLHPGFSFLLREMGGFMMSEKQRWVNLSDGGHIENLAIYELLRRRCKFVICIDGECDPEFQFHGLVTLIRHARIDFGVRITPDLSELRKQEETGHSRSHSHLCRIRYPATNGQAASTGLLLYVKLSTTGNESELIQRYQAKHPEFPHQTTMDQFFDEEQFEAYRQLGAHVGEGLFASCLTTGNTEPDSVKDWFKSLSKNLLLPE